jgi:hypothetical protein
MKKMKKTSIGKKGQLNTNTTNPAVKGADSRKGFVMSNPASITQGAGRKPGGGGKAMGTIKGRGGRSY